MQPKDEMALAHRLETHREVVRSLVTSFAAEGDPQFTVDAFDNLINWIDNSLDIYRVRQPPMRCSAVHACGGQRRLAWDELADMIKGGPPSTLQGELSRVLYPVFLHTYLELVNRDATAAASSLLHK